MGTLASIRVVKRRKRRAPRWWPPMTVCAV